MIHQIFRSLLTTSTPKLTAAPLAVSQISIPWFPKTVQQLDTTNFELTDCESAFEGDHPTFSDLTYRERRNSIAEASAAYKLADGRIPFLPYTKEETKCWSTVYTELKKLHENYACEEYNQQFNALEKEGILRPDEIP